MKKNFNTTIKEARNFAKEKHINQKYGDYDYIFHLDDVFNICSSFSLSNLVKISAYLHDTIEDTNTTKEEIINKFGEEIFNIVNAVTAKGNNRKEKTEFTISQIKNNIDAINLKMADRYANMKQSYNNNHNLFKMYTQEFHKYENIFKDGDETLFNAIKELSEKQIPQKRINNF